MSKLVYSTVLYLPSNFIIWALKAFMITVKKANSSYLAEIFKMQTFVAALFCIWNHPATS